jgi:hypothetical protein
LIEKRAATGRPFCFDEKGNEADRTLKITVFASLGRSWIPDVATVVEICDSLGIVTATYLTTVS